MAVGSKTDCAPGDSAFAPQNPWETGKRRLIFPAIFLVLLLQTVGGVADHAHGAWAVVGYLLVALFCVVYLFTLPAVWTGRDRAFWLFYAGLVAIAAVEVGIAHQDAFPMFIFITILAIARGGRWAIVVGAAFIAVVLLLPPAIGSWHAGADTATAASIVLVSLAMYAFFGIIRTNHTLEEARAEVATLAAEAERNRIARDLHDLLGHSLTTITVKSGLAKRLAEQDPARAAIEIGEVEELARRSLAEVRAAVSQYRVVTLANELATAQEVMRAAGIDAHVLTPPDTVDPDLQELFGWAVREATTNVVRHAHATACTIRLDRRSIEIIDNGFGGANSWSSGNGLNGLRERLDPVGGTVEAGANRGGGWRIAVSVP